MLRHSCFRNRLLLLCVVLLLGRVSGAHVHLCFDGTEPPASFHLFDPGLHHAEPGMDVPHADVDVAIAADLQSKSKFERQLLLALLATIVLPGMLRAPRQFVVPLVSRAFPVSPPFLRPPLRGPPLLTSL